MTDPRSTETTDPTSDPTPDTSEGRSNQHFGWALVLICTAQVMVVLDATIANIALPYIGSDLDFSSATLSWVVTAYALAFGGLLLLGGRLGDLFGRRRIFMIGLIVFAIGSLLGGIATSEGVLLGARGVQGIGAAMASPSALALITTTFPAGKLRQRAFGIYAALSGAGGAIGLLLGGWLTGHDSFFGFALEGWRLTFLINVPIGLAAAIAAPFLLPAGERSRNRLDIPGALLGTGGLLAIVYGLTRAAEEQHGWGDTGTIAALVGGVVLLGAFLTLESRIEHPLLPLRILAHRTRATSFFAMMVVPAAMFAMFYFLSLYVQNLAGWSPLRTGFAFLPFTFGVVAGATVTSRLISRVNPRYLAGTGTLLAALGMFGFSRLPDDVSASTLLQRVAAGEPAIDFNYWTHMLPPVLLMSFGMGLTFVTLTLTAVHHVRPEDSGIGSGVLNTMQQVGGALGLAALSTVATHLANSRADDLVPQLTQAAGSSHLSGAQAQSLIGAAAQYGAFAHGATTAFLVGSVMVLIGSVAVWLLLDVPPEELATDGPAESGVHVG